MEERITSRKNPLLQQVKKLLSSRSMRRETGLFVCDGTKLLDEAVLHCPELDTVIASDGVSLASLPDGVRVVRVPEDVLAGVSPMESPQGVVFLCRLPELGPLSIVPGTLILDGIQDPGNLGTILRTADAMNVPVVLMEGCADPYGWKAARATMGAIFRSKPMVGSWTEVRRAANAAGVPLVATALTDMARDLRQSKLDRSAVIIGSEGRGIRREVLEGCDETVIIPMNPHCESLNAGTAAAIVLWEMRRTYF